MLKYFREAVLAVCGTLAATIPASATTIKVATPYYYYFSPASWIREMRNFGQSRYILHEGQKLNYTHKNRNGRRPGGKADLVLMGFGNDPLEGLYIVDRAAFDSHRARKGLTRRRSVVVDAATRHADVNKRPAPAKLASVKPVAAKPATGPRTTAAPRIRPGGKSLG